MPLLTQGQVGQTMREEKEAAMRGYGDIFTPEGGEDKIIKGRDVLENW